jgi:hypothetical protein
MKRMKQGRFAVSLAVVLSVISLVPVAGCGGGGDSTPSTLTTNPTGTPSAPDRAASAARVVEGQAAMNNLLQTDTPSPAQLVRMRDTFAEAYRLDNTNPEAAFGLAVSTVAVRTQQAAIALTISGRSRAETESVLSGLTGTILPWQLNVPNADWGKNALQMVIRAPFTAQGLTRGRQVNGTILRRELAGISDSLNTALPLMEQATAASGLAFPLQSEATGAVVVDQADARALLGAMYAARAGLNATLAYDINPGSFRFDESLDRKFGIPAIGTRISPDQYFPPAPFGNLSRAADTVRLAATTLASRPTQTGHLIDATGINLGTIVAASDTFKAALDNPYPLGNGTVVNLNAWFTNPPQSLRALLPTYTVVMQDTGAGFRQVYFVAEPSDYPDRSFGGLITSQPPDSPKAEVAVNGEGTVSDLLIQSVAGGLLDGLSTLGESLR